MSLSSFVLARRKFLTISGRLNVLSFFATEIGDVRASPYARFVKGSTLLWQTLLLPLLLYSLAFQQFYQSNLYKSPFPQKDSLHRAANWLDITCINLQHLASAVIEFQVVVEEKTEALLLLCSSASYQRISHQGAKDVSQLASVKNLKC